MFLSKKIERMAFNIIFCCMTILCERLTAVNRKVIEKTLFFSSYLHYQFSSIERLDRIKHNIYRLLLMIISEALQTSYKLLSYFL